jgi:arylsulfatase A
MRKEKPNIVYILADDMGYGDMGCNNPGSRIPTPNLDRLAAGGVRFTDAHSTSSVCTPSRYSILTGRYCWRTPLKRSVLWPWDPPLVTPGRLTVARMLRQNGYRTASFGKWHLGWEWATLNGEKAYKGTRSGKFDMAKRRELERNIDFSKVIRGGPLDSGFEYYFGVDVPNFPPYTWFEQDRLLEQPTEQKPEGMYGFPGLMEPDWKLEEVIPELTRRVSGYIKDSGGDPFFLYFALTSPHTPIVPNREFIGRSKNGLYGDFVCEVDWVLGEIMKVLEQKGIADNTLLIFTSDNGPECISDADGGAYEHIRQYGHYSMGHLRGVKRDAWEGGHRVPFIVRWPEVISPGTECGQLIGQGDLIATCADLLGVELPEGQAEDSVSILPLLRGDIMNPVRDSIVHHSASGKFALRRGDWVFIDAPSGDDNKEPDWFKKERGYTSHNLPGELFNLKDDITERINHFAGYPQVVKEMSLALKQIKGSDDVEVDCSDSNGPESE